MTRTHRHQPGLSVGSINRNTGEVLELCRCVHCAHMLVRSEGGRTWRTIADHVRRRTHRCRASLV